MSIFDAFNKDKINILINYFSVARDELQMNETRRITEEEELFKKKKNETSKRLKRRPFEELEEITTCEYE